VSAPRRARRPAAPLLDVREVTVRFSGLTALDAVDLRVWPGEIAAVIGPNGAGKTTLFNVITGFVPPSSGVVAFGGRRINHLQPARRAARGLARSFQQGGLWPSESALANLLLAQHLAVGPGAPTRLLALGPAQRRRQLDRVAVARRSLAVLGLEQWADVPVRSMPYGSRKLLELGCALAARPRLLLLDEPAAGLSSAESDWLAGIIGGIRDRLGVAVILIEHRVPLVTRVADHITVLNFGRVLAHGAPAAVVDDPAVVEAYIGTDDPGALMTADRP
jgi:branched-chain amino acid transport system ATP-binding protein